MIVRRWDGLRTAAIAAELGCDPQTVRERFARFNAEGLDGLEDRPGRGRQRRLTEAARSRIIALVAMAPPGRLVRDDTGVLAAENEQAPAHWTLTVLAAAAQATDIQVDRSQVRRMLIADKVRWRQPRSWATSTDPEFAPKGHRSSHSTPTRPRGDRDLRR